MFVTFDVWAVLKRVYKGGSTADGTNYQLTMSRTAAWNLYQELKAEFEK